MNNINELFINHNLEEIFQKYHPVEMVNNLSFKDGMLLAYRFLFNDKMDDHLREFAVKLFEECRQTYSKEWDEDWRNEVLLGDAYGLIMKYKERYTVCKRASEKFFPTPPAILVSLAGCYLLPDSTVHIDDAEKLVFEALKKEKSVEAATLIRGIYKTKKT
jgi:hypothetical protein